MIVATKLKISSFFLLFLSLIGATWALPAISHAAAPHSNVDTPVQATWTSVSVSATGQYQTAVIGNIYEAQVDGIYTSSDFGLTWDIADTASKYPNWNSVSMSSDGRHQTALGASIFGSPGEGFFTSSNFGATWTMALSLKENWCSVSLSSSGASQFAVSRFGLEYLSPGSVFYSSDYGKTWRITGAPRLEWKSVSVASDGPSRTAVSAKGIYTADDENGNSWTRRSTPATQSDSWVSVSLSSTGQYQTALNSIDGICTSSDYGATWTIAMAPSASHIWWECVSLSSTGQYQTALANDDKPEGDADGIYTSSDFGATWTIALSLKQDWPNYWKSVSLSSTGQYQTAVVSGTPGGAIYISSDYGAKWRTVSRMTPLPRIDTTATVAHTRHGRPSPLRSLKLGGHKITDDATAAEQLSKIQSQAQSQAIFAERREAQAESKKQLAARG